MNPKTIISLKSRLTAVASKILRRPEDVDDAYQDLFLKLSQVDDVTRDEEQRKAYVVSAMRNLCIDRVRRSRFEADADDKDRLIEQVIDDTPPPDNSDMAIDHIKAVVKDRLSGLPLKVFELYAYDELDHDEIAQRLSITVQASRTYLCRARATLRNYSSQLLN